MKQADASEAHPEAVNLVIAEKHRAWALRLASEMEHAPMALGVLNNLSAIYAEHNLNNTNKSLQQVLQQLSSGSRINSGADDAAGLSLVNGLAANAAALTQSTTNVAEGVGLLQVADGALMQVTNLLNRAVTLATEASNGTLNATQESAANQEYQSVLAEISNIGSTTTYNQEQVFAGHMIAIYTGDSSTTGSSIDQLNIRTLSQSSIGDTNGVMSYTSGQANVFLNLSTASTNATPADTLNASGATTIDVNYLVKSGNSGSGMATTQISVGTGTSYANTVSGLINAIDNAGLGLTATFSTQADAGVTGGGLQTGIKIAGGLVSVGAAPNSVSTSGMLTAGGIAANELLTQGQIITLNQGGSQVAQVTISPSINTLAELADAINTQAGAGTASVVTNGDSSLSLALNDTASTQGALTVTVQAGSGAAVPVFGAATAATNAPALATASGVVAGTGAVTGVPGSATFGTSGTNSGADLLSVGGSIILTNSQSGTALTFIVGNGVNTATTFYSNGNGNTVNGLIATINAQAPALGATAALAAGNAGIKVTATAAATGENITASANSLTQANNTLGLYNPILGGPGVFATAVLQLNASAPNIATIDDTNDALTGSVVLTSNGVTHTFVMGAGVSTATTIYTGANTVASLVGAINGDNGVGKLNLSATAPGGGTGGIYLQAQTVGALYNISMNAGTSTLADVGNAIDHNYQGETSVSTANGLTAVTGVNAAVTLGLPSGTVNTSDVLATGSSISLTNGGSTYTFTIGSGTSNSTTTYLASGTTLAQLAVAISGVAGLGLTAGASTTGLSLTQTVPQGNSITVNSNSLADSTLGSYSTISLGSFANLKDTISGTINFSVGGVSKTLTVNAGSTVQDLINQMNGTANLGVHATWVPTSNGFGNVLLTATSEGAAGQISAPTAAVIDTTKTANLGYTPSSGYDTGLRSNASNVVYNSSSGQNATTGAAAFVSDESAGSGSATMSYTDEAGASLAGTNLLTQSAAEAALNSINLAISDVAAQDGYIGAQINTLNAISQVMSTQQENVVSAQNAIQATDYAAATSSMSKFEILSQTGIAALAQANSVQQEVLKLLQ